MPFLPALSLQILLEHTENANGASCASEDSECADILLSKGILDGRDEGAGATSYKGGLDGRAHGILGVVVCGPLVEVGHGCGVVERRGGVCGQSVPFNGSEVVSCFARAGQPEGRAGGKVESAALAARYALYDGSHALVQETELGMSRKPATVA